jgi:hypothetical protein
MTDNELDRTPGYVNKLAAAMADLALSIDAQGVGVSQKLDLASDRLATALAKAAEASEKHARSLVLATYWLAGATVALVLVTAVHAYIAYTH